MSQFPLSACIYCSFSISISWFLSSCDSISGCFFTCLDCSLSICFSPLSMDLHCSLCLPHLLSLSLSFSLSLHSQWPCFYKSVFLMPEGFCMLKGKKVWRNLSSIDPLHASSHYLIVWRDFFSRLGVWDWDVFNEPGGRCLTRESLAKCISLSSARTAAKILDASRSSLTTGLLATVHEASSLRKWV